MPYDTKEKQQEWIKANKERVREHKRKWYLKNKNKIKYKQNTEKAIKKFKEKHEDGLHRVYLLEDYNYVGVTKNLHQRFIQHKRINNRDCTNYRILHKTKDRDEALELESLLHDMGYEGKHHKNLYK